MEFWLAPLHGITNYPFRNCLHRHVAGFNVAVTPFLAVQERSKLNVRKWLDVLPENNPDLEIIPQLIGNQPSHFVDTILELQQFGYTRFNWNIGCPAHQVVRKQRGCGLMPYPERVEAVVNEVLGKTDCRFSIKMRIGLKSPEESFAIMERLQNYPLDFLCIHPRLGVQEYEGEPDLETFRRLFEMSRNRVVYSGDVFDVDSFQKICALVPDLQAIMLGRGILRNIFLAEELSNASCVNTIDKSLLHNDLQERFLHFYKDLETMMFATRGEHALAPLKELWHYFRFFWNVSDDNLQILMRKTAWNEFSAFAYSLMD